MLVSVLCSGSEGNCTLVRSGNTCILIDLGLNNKYIVENLLELGIDPNDINAVLVTHAHKDHTGAMKVFLKNYHPLLYLNDGIESEIKDFIGDYDNISYESNKFKISEEISVESFNTSHDALGSRGFIISDKNNSMVYVTDTGYINSKLFNILKNKNLYVFEANHDTEMLMHGRYPTWLKQRILSDYGHLSNEQAGFYLSRIIGPDTKKIILAHLSHENNNSDIAIKTVKNSLIENDIKFDDIICAKQRERTDVYI